MNLNATILGQTLAFILFVWFCMKYIWPPIITAIETRQKEIEDSLLDKEKAQKELYLIQDKIKIQIKEAKEKAFFIIEEANKQKIEILEVAKKQSINESKKIFVKTQAEIDTQIVNARINLHREVVDLAMLMAEKIIQKSIDKHHHADLIKDFTTSFLKVKN